MYGPLYLVLGGVFILRTISTPVLYTGEIKDPQDDYDTKDGIIAVTWVTSVKTPWIVRF